jgi:hypothetical protein
MGFVDEAFGKLAGLGLLSAAVWVDADPATRRGEELVFDPGAFALAHRGVASGVGLLDRLSGLAQDPLNGLRPGCAVLVGCVIDNALQVSQQVGVMPISA